MTNSSQVKIYPHGKRNYQKGKTAEQIPADPERFDYPYRKGNPLADLKRLWLEQAGFKKGDRVEILVENNLLTIKNSGKDGNTRD